MSNLQLWAWARTAVDRATEAYERDQPYKLPETRRRMAESLVRDCVVALRVAALDCGAGHAALLDLEAVLTAAGLPWPPTMAIKIREILYGVAQARRFSKRGKYPNLAAELAGSVEARLRYEAVCQVLKVNEIHAHEDTLLLPPRDGQPLRDAFGRIVLQPWMWLSPEEAEQLRAERWRTSDKISAAEARNERSVAPKGSRGKGRDPAPAKYPVYAAGLARRYLDYYSACARRHLEGRPEDPPVPDDFLRTAEAEDRLGYVKSERVRKAFNEVRAARRRMKEPRTLEEVLECSGPIWPGPYYIPSVETMTALGLRELSLMPEEMGILPDAPIYEGQRG